MLNVDIDVNGNPIGSIRIRRISPRRIPRDDDICKYRWRIFLNGTERTNTVLLEHRFGDGALSLIAKVIEEVSSMT